MRAFVIALTIAAAGAARAAEDGPRVTHAGMAAPDIIAIEIRAGRVEYGRQVAYAKRPGDRIDRKSHQRWVWRDGRFLGSLVGREEKILYTPDRLLGRFIEPAALDGPGNYSVKVGPAELKPAAVHRKTKPTDLARVTHWQFISPTVDTVYLKLGRRVAGGEKVQVRNTRDTSLSAAFTWKPRETRSEAVHVSHLGFRPDDPAKVAFLSCWMGTGGGLKYEEGLKFEVIDAGTGEVAFTGKTRLSKAAADATEDPYKRNYNGADVHGMDFSEMKAKGEYRVSVEGVGCSYPFRIDDDAWRRAFYVSARGFYHQRSGIALEKPYTDFKRPRSMHPADGVKVCASTASLMDTGNGLNRKDSNFGSLVRGKTDEIVKDAWGAYMDAGDWDRRIQHLIVSRYLIELAELFPEYFDGLSLNIPESKDGLPDVVSEALFNLDCYRRMQTPEGGIRGGIESSEHPRHGEGSWQESLDVIAYAPGVWSSHVYAGVAAQAAHLLEKRRPRLAAEYRRSAVRAMEWAERELPKRAGKEDPHRVADDRNLAAAELWRLTGEKRWHDLFLKTTAFTDPNATLYVWKKHEQREAAWVYMRTERPGASDEIKANCRSALMREAAERLGQQKKTAFRWTKHPWRPMGWGALAAPNAVSLVRAHHATGEAKYLRAAVLACQFGAGANPSNLCYTTGLGHESPLHPLHIDSRVTHQPPPPGLTVFGPMDTKKSQNEWGQKLANQTLRPKGAEWPTAEAYWDIFWFPPMCEFTVQQPMAANAYVWGYLAARK